MDGHDLVQDGSHIKLLPGLAAAAQVARWAGRGARRGPTRSWRMMEDTDGALLLLPLRRAEPGFAILPHDREYEVLVCDPESTEEIGPFASLDAALAGISWWLRLPQRCFTLSAPEGGADPEAAREKSAAC